VCARVIVSSSVEDREFIEIQRYAEEFAQVVRLLMPLLVYLSPVETKAHLSEFVFPFRGREWVRKVCF
jgi:hypothetical protein